MQDTITRIDGYYLQIIAPNTPEHNLFVQSLEVKSDHTKTLCNTVNLGEDDQLFIDKAKFQINIIDYIRNILMSKGFDLQLKEVSIITNFE